MTFGAPRFREVIVNGETFFVRDDDGPLLESDLPTRTLDRIAEDERNARERRERSERIDEANRTRPFSQR